MEGMETFNEHWYDKKTHHSFQSCTLPNGTDIYGDLNIFLSLIRMTRRRLMSISISALLTSRDIVLDLNIRTYATCTILVTIVLSQ